MAASTKTDYSPSVPDPSTLVGPGGVEHHIVRVRGLPWSCTENELIEFFEGVCIQSVHFTRDRDGRPSGDAYMVLASLKDQKLAHKFHKAHMGNRYLEVFEARYSEMSWMLTKNVDKNPKEADKLAEYEEFEPESDAIVKMRGLPFEAGPAEIIRFFDELPVAEKGILICKDSNRRPSGEGYCVFADEESATEALKRDNASMGHRYIELFKATKEEALKAKRRSENPGEYEDTRYRALGYGGGPTKSLGFGGGGPMRSGAGPGFGRGFGRPSPYDRPSGGPRGGGMPQGPYDMMSYSGGRGGGPMRGGGGGGRNMGYGYGPYAYGNNGGYGGGRGGGNPPPLMGSGGSWSNNSSRGGEPPAPGDSSNPWSGAYDNDGFSNQRNNEEEQHIIKMRGVPFKATEMEISEWFSSCASCQDVNIMYGPDGRPSGTAEVTFRTEADAKAAMAKHRQNMGSRYIELFYEAGY